eukprot:TRINITY_DN6919_c0_g1_i1.p1 TRINITY_DN6919_c0_g1~~TRINITY_DN6919_c0_g1_i1.p1  ORF type:complete len:1044 (-),score=279.20 TRINITY_DN6919_c0_g1_i1:496-3246(-)
MLESLRVCHVSPSAADKVWEVCQQLGWNVCSSCGVYDFGKQSTLCRMDAPTLRHVLEPVRDWLSHPCNAQELLLVKLETYTQGRAELISSALATMFGASRIYSTAEFTADASRWPTVGELVARGKNLLFVSATEPSSLVHPLLEELVEPADMRRAGCPVQRPHGFQRVQGGAEVVELNLNGQHLYRFEDAPDMFLSAEDVSKTLQCQYIPAFDRLNATLLASTIWSWAEGAPAQSQPPENTCAYVAVGDGRWHDEPCKGALKLPYACVDPSRRRKWSVSAATGSGTSVSPRSDPSEDGTGKDQDGGSGGGGVGGARADASWGDSGGDRGCPAGTVFGAPTTALENRLLQRAMEAARVTRVWIDVRTNAVGCWVAEGGSPHCLEDGSAVATEDDGTCDAPPEPLPLPDSMCNAVNMPWDEHGYTAPQYTATAITRAIHNTARIRGTNCWDLSSTYFIPTAYSAVPFIIIGSLLALMVMPCVGRRLGRWYAHRQASWRTIVTAPASGANKWLHRGCAACCVLAMGAALAVLVASGSLDRDVMQVRQEVVRGAELIISAHNTARTLEAALRTVQYDLKQLAPCLAALSFNSIVERVDDKLVAARSAVGAVVDKDYAAVGRRLLEGSRAARNAAAAFVAAAAAVSVVVLVVGATYMSLISRATEAVRHGYDLGAVKKAQTSVTAFKFVFVPLVMLLVVGSWTAAGVLTSGELVLADLCVDPRQLIASAVRPFGSAAELVEHYLNCNSDSSMGTLLSTGYLFSLVAAADVDAIPINWQQQCPNELFAKEEMAQSLASIRDATADLTGQLRCANINPMYVTAVEGAICTRTVPTLALIIAGFMLVGTFLALASILLTVLLSRTTDEMCTTDAQHTKLQVELTVLDDDERSVGTTRRGSGSYSSCDSLPHWPHHPVPVPAPKY